MAAFIIGRSPDCNLVLSASSVSARHAKLAWKNGLILVEDLASSNGVWVNGQRVRSALVRPGDEVLLGTEKLPWSREELRPFLRLGAQGTRLATPPSRVRRVFAIAGRIVGAIASVLTLAILVALTFPAGREAIRGASDTVASMVGSFTVPTTDQEAYIRARVARNLKRAIDPTDPVTRDLAVQLAAGSQGAFRVEQVAAIWGYVREHWRYVNDPNGREYFAKASESIANGFAGDCDDFAITLAAMTGAIGGESRVIFMEGPEGGHAYSEVCIHQDPSTVASELAHYYGTRWARYAGAQRGAIAFRHTDACPVWLNLDWNASVPGGPYASEQWAVAIYPDGHTESLSPASSNRALAQDGASTAPQQAALPPPAH